MENLLNQGPVDCAYRCRCDPFIPTQKIPLTLSCFVQVSCYKPAPVTHTYADLLIHLWLPYEKFYRIDVILTFKLDVDRYYGATLRSDKIMSSLCYDTYEHGDI